MDEKIVLAIAQKKARQASSVTQEKVTEAVSDYITDNPNILNQAAVEAIVDDRIDDIVLVQDEQPTEEDNKIWIPNENIEEVQVPTYEEFSGLKNEVDAMGSATSEDEGKALIAKTVSNGKVTEWEFGDTGGVQDVQVNGVSVLSDGVANVPLASGSAPGVVKVAPNDFGTNINANGQLYLNPASENQCKAGTSQYRPLTPVRQHNATFYGLAKAAGADEKDSTLPVGQYTEPAKSAIRSMLGVQNFDPQSIAIVANGDTHAAILSGQYVYVQGHSSLADGLYVAKSPIQVDGSLSTSNLTAASGGGLNSVIARVENQQTASITWDSDHTPSRSDLAQTFKKGQTCQMIFWNVSWANEITADTAVGTIPAGFRPPEKTFFYGFNRLNQLCKGWISYDGTIYISLFPGELMYVSCTYLAGY